MGQLTEKQEQDTENILDTVNQISEQLVAGQNQLAEKLLLQEQQLALGEANQQNLVSGGLAAQWLSQDWIV